MKTLASTISLSAAAIAVSAAVSAQPAQRKNFNEGWTFTKDGTSRVVNLPHDWGVDGPFVQEYPGETAKLAWWGQAEYSKTLHIDGNDLRDEDYDGKDYFLDIEGAMSYAKVFCNGKLVTEWPYGYASFRADLSRFLKAGDNEIKVTLDNPQESSRWYPGGGIYRNVWLTESDPAGVAEWGTFVTAGLSNFSKRTDAGGRVSVTCDASVNIDITLRNSGQLTDGTVKTEIYPLEGDQECSELKSKDILDDAETQVEEVRNGVTVMQQFDLKNAKVWSPGSPDLYVAVTTVTAGTSKEVYYTTFGLRKIEYKEDGLYLNGEKTFIKGVCLHHDAGALGAVWNTSAWVRRLNILKKMGCNAIRTSHNPPAPELLDLCDRMGFLVMDEFSDTWTIPKKPNGYAKLFDSWADKDLRAMIHRDRNHPSVIMWSIGNEVPEQGYPDKYNIAYHLSGICHLEDPTRLTTFGSDNPWASEQDFRNAIDIYGFNYKPHLYEKFHSANPGKPYFGSETASTVSSRGVYIFPISDKKEGALDNFQVCSYDIFTVPWGQTPEQEWAGEDKNPSCLGEFVWTGFDYLGEPTPYNSDLTILSNFHDPEAKAKAEKELTEKGSIATPSRSSYFGIVDLAGFGKDRYWLYKARWNQDEPFIHILPHWNWSGREGQETPVHVYTDCDSVELFVNGKSLGMKVRGDKQYRLRWDEAVYEPGEVKAVGFSRGKKIVQSVSTTGKSSKLMMAVEKGYGPSESFGGDGSKAEYAVQPKIPSDVGTLYYVDVKVADSKGRTVPTACNDLKFRLYGHGEIVAVDAGDPTCHTPFHSGEIKAFNGLCSVIVRSTGRGKLVLHAESAGLEKAHVSIK